MGTGLRRMLSKFCPHMGCKRLIGQNERACPVHIGYYDKNIRKGPGNKQYDDFYQSVEWEQGRKPAIARDKGLCVHCLREKTIKAFHVVHHIIPIKTPEGWRRRIDVDNMVCLCEKHHQIAEKQARGA